MVLVARSFEGFPLQHPDCCTTVGRVKSLQIIKKGTARELWCCGIPVWNYVHTAPSPTLIALIAVLRSSTLAIALEYSRYCVRVFALCCCLALGTFSPWPRFRTRQLFTNRLESCCALSLLLTIFQLPARMKRRKCGTDRMWNCLAVAGCCRKSLNAKRRIAGRAANGRGCFWFCLFGFTSRFVRLFNFVRCSNHSSNTKVR